MPERFQLDTQGDNAFRRAARGAFWGGFAAISIVMAYKVSLSEDAAQRLTEARQEAVQLAGLYRDMRDPGAPALAAAPDDGASEGEKTDLAGDVESLRSRLALLEDQLGAVTGSLREDAAAAASRTPAYSMLSPVREETRNDPFVPDQGAGAASRVTSTGFALALSTASEIAGLEQAWAQLKKKFPNELNGLEPQVQLDRDSGGTTLLLLAGRFANAREAARLCARIKAAGADCRAVPLTGPAIALNADQG